MLPRGRYTSVVTATDGTLVATQAVAFETDAFRLKLSDTTPGRGQTITVTVTSAELLAKIPRLYDLPAGLARWSVRMTKVSGAHLQGDDPAQVERQGRARSRSGSAAATPRAARSRRR